MGLREDELHDVNKAADSPQPLIFYVVLSHRLVTVLKERVSQQVAFEFVNLLEDKVAAINTKDQSRFLHFAVMLKSQLNPGVP